MDEAANKPAMSQQELKAMATEVAEALKAAEALPAMPPGGGGSRPRNLPEGLRERFIAVRSALFQRGLFDPVLVRFDSATVPPASTAEVAEQLAAVAASL
ncbi:MAG: hypothetical protein JWN02_660 [Acidobacteria bacterium]|jgi:hypothetical protein|nr:hypothetical protein [Acidobacteriota bacterium]